jgi:hypothetical protein
MNDNLCDAMVKCNHFAPIGLRVLHIGGVSRASRANNKRYREGGSLVDNTAIAKLLGMLHAFASKRGAHTLV